MRAGVAYALSVDMLSLLFLAGFILMTFPRNKTLMELGVLIIMIALFIAVPILSTFIEKYPLSLP
jgi:diacylglycerol kinase